VVVMKSSEFGPGWDGVRELGTGSRFCMCRNLIYLHYKLVFVVARLYLSCV
jgi:hypothetical protein